MREEISQEELEFSSIQELKTKFNFVAAQLAHLQNECQKHVITLHKIQAVIHRRRS